MTNQAITWRRYQQSLTPGKPFFVYFATGTTHAPHQSRTQNITVKWATLSA
jgi:arylsulfatase A-like enzyme